MMKRETAVAADTKAATGARHRRLGRSRPTSTRWIASSPLSRDLCPATALGTEVEGLRGHDGGGDHGGEVYERERRHA
jgi:hypothetical protein